MEKRNGCGRVGRRKGRLTTMTSSDGQIDLMQDFASLYAREEMLAFFDFALDRPAAPAVSGLCRISQPKSGGTGSHYLSLTFIVDTPDDAARTMAQRALDKLEPDALSKALPEIREVIIVPSINASSDSYVAQADLMMRVEPPRAFIAAQLVPALGRLTGFKIVEFVWWEAPKTASKAAGSDAGRSTGTSSLASRLSQFFKEQLGIR
jgi:hypothetical protein